MDANPTTKYLLSRLEKTTDLLVRDFILVFLRWRNDVSCAPFDEFVLIAFFTGAVLSGVEEQ